LILKVAGAKLWKMIIYSVIMLITGYFGEVVYGYGLLGLFLVLLILQSFTKFGWVQLQN
jgi:hypothetical protein